MDQQTDASTDHYTAKVDFRITWKPIAYAVLMYLGATATGVLDDRIQEMKPQGTSLALLSWWDLLGLAAEFGVWALALGPVVVLEWKASITKSPEAPFFAERIFFGILICYLAALDRSITVATAYPLYSWKWYALQVGLISIGVFLFKWRGYIIAPFKWLGKNFFQQILPPR